MDHNSGVINTGSIGGNVTVNNQAGATALAAAERAELQALELELRQQLKAMAAAKPDETEAVKECFDALIEKIGKEKVNRKSIEISAKGMLEAASAIEGIVPVAARIAGIVTSAFGLPALF